MLEARSAALVRLWPRSPENEVWQKYHEHDQAGKATVFDDLHKRVVLEGVEGEVSIGQLELC